MIASRLKNTILSKIMKFNYTPQKIMLTLSRDRLNQLGEIWESNTVGIDIIQFIQLMLDRIQTEDDDETYELIYGCYKLFHEVDINGDGMMEWAEFMQYIIDAVAATTITNEGSQSVAEQIAKIKAKKFQKFAFDRNKIDKNHHTTGITKAIYCGSSELVLAFEKYQKEVTFHSLNFEIIKREKLPFKKQAFVTSCAYDEKNKLFGITATDKVLYIYQKTRVRIELMTSVEAECIQERVWFMQKQQFWLTAGNDFKLRHWNIRKQGELLQTLNLHTDLITDCVEILNPLCIATCSRDKKIILFDIEHREHLRTINEHHMTPIRYLRYQSNQQTQMISISSDIEVNVWAPESLVSDIHLGKLRGHKKQITDGQYLGRAPYFVTIDETNLICLWDIVTLQCIQNFVCQQKLNSEGLVVLNNNIFWSYGKRFNQFDTFGQADEDDKQNQEFTSGNKNKEDLNFAQQVIINDYLMQIIVVLRTEVRLYDIITGQLVTLHSNIFQDQDLITEITYAQIDKRHRKVYISNNKGKIIVINCQNGVIVKNVTQFIEDKENIIKQEAIRLKKLKQEKLLEEGGSKRPPVFSKRKGLKKSDSLTSLGSSHYSERDDNLQENLEEVDMAKLGKTEQESSSDHDDAQKQLDKLQRKNLEIIDLHLLWEDDLIMMIVSNKIEYIVYDEQSTEESKMLRRVRGAHEEEISISAFDFHLGLIATGCVNGEIALYDFELSKVEGLLIGHTADITGLEFMSPYPILLSSSIDCTVCIWGVRPIAEKLYNVCIKRFINVSWQFDRDVNTPITKIHLWKSQKMKGIKKYRRLPGKMLAPSCYRYFEQNFVFSFKQPDELFDEEYAEVLKNEITYRKPNTEQRHQMVLESKIYQQVLNDDVSKLFVTQVPVDDEQYNQNIDQEIERIYVYIGDEQGYLKIWNFSNLFSNLNITKVQKRIKLKSAFNPRRKGIINNQFIGQQIRLSLKQKKLPLQLDPVLQGLQIREVQAHLDTLTAISKINYDDCQCILTASRDSTVKIWSYGLDLFGTLDVATNKDDPLWKVSTQQKKITLEADVSKVEILMDKLKIDLQSKRKKLIVGSEKIQVQVQEKYKPRANWYTIQEERRKQDIELKKEHDKMERQIQNEKIRNQRIVEKLAYTIQEQEITYQILQMNVSHEVSKGYSRQLQNELSTLQNDYTIGLLKQLEEENSEKNIKLKKNNSLTKKTNGKLTQQLSEKKKQEKRLTKQLSPQNFLEFESQPVSPKKFNSVLNNYDDQSYLSESKKSPGGKNKQISLQQKLSLSLLELKKDQSEKDQFTFTQKVMEHRLSNNELKQQIKNSKSVAVKSKQALNIKQKLLEASREDKKKLFDLAMVPKLRQKLVSLSNQDRFATISQTEPDQFFMVKSTQNKQKPILSTQQSIHKFMKQTNIVQLASATLNSQDSFKNIQIKQRRLSIADSEIQKVEQTNDFLQRNDSLDSTEFQNTETKMINKGLIQASLQKQNNEQQILKLPPLMNNHQDSTNYELRSLLKGVSQQENIKQSISQLSRNSPAKQYTTRQSTFNVKNLSPNSVVALRNLNVHYPSEVEIFQSVPKIISKNPLASKFIALESLNLKKKYDLTQRIERLHSPKSFKNNFSEINGTQFDNRKLSKSPEIGMNSDIKLPKSISDQLEIFSLKPKNEKTQGSSSTASAHQDIQLKMLSFAPQRSKQIISSLGKNQSKHIISQSFAPVSVKTPFKMRDDQSKIFKEVFSVKEDSIYESIQEESSQIKKRFRDSSVKKSTIQGIRSMKTFISDRDIQKNEHFQEIKQKYQGPNSLIAFQQKSLKQRLEEQKEMVKQLKNQTKMN